MTDWISFRINTPTVVHERFENEIVVIHLDSGNYYTLNDGGAHIWQLLQHGLTKVALIEAIAQATGTVATNISEEVEQFLYKLQREELIIPVATTDAATALLAIEASNPQPTLTPFPIPTLRKYTDLQDLLLLDPIHDVEESGWPNGKHP